VISKSCTRWRALPCAGGRNHAPAAVDIVAEYEKTILNELDLMREAANAAQLRRNWLGSPLIYVPQVYFDWCRVDVMVMERIHGMPRSSDMEAAAGGTNIPRLAANGVEIFFTQVFRDNFFHADMHPGNIFVLIDEPGVSALCRSGLRHRRQPEPRDSRYLAENFMAFFERDYYRVAKLHVDSGWVPADTRVDELESACARLRADLQQAAEGHFLRQVLLQLFDIARRFDMVVQPQLILLQKTLVKVEGLGRVLYPDLDIWQTGKPVLKAWMRDQTGPRATLRRLRRDWPDMRYALEKLPLVARKLVDEALEGEAGGQTDADRAPTARSNVQPSGHATCWESALPC
jgi:ubiquinone biosynthesis protein